jgi:DNA-binding response OmpR family regulator
MNQRILIIDDEKPLAEALNLKLSHEGFDVYSVYSGKDAIEALKKQYYDLIILDILMPEQDGFMILEEIKILGLKTPVIINSNLNQDSDIARAKSLGAVDYYIKSNTNLSGIVEKIKSFLIK